MGRSFERCLKLLSDFHSMILLGGRLDPLLAVGFGAEVGCLFQKSFVLISDSLLFDYSHNVHEPGMRSSTRFASYFVYSNFCAI